MDELEQRATESSTQAEQAKAEAAEWKAKYEAEHRQLEAYTKRTEMLMRELLLSQANLEDATAQLKQLQTDVLAAQTAANGNSEAMVKQILELKRGDRYKTPFQIACVKVLFGGVPECRAAEVVRSVLEYATGKRLPNLKLPATSTFARMSEAGKILAEAVACKRIADCGGGLVLYIDGTSRKQRYAQGTTIGTEDGDLLGGGWTEIPTKAGKDAFEALKRQLADIAEAGQRVFDVHINLWLRVTVIVVDGGGPERVCIRLAENLREQRFLAAGKSPAEAKELAKIQQVQCSKHYLGNDVADMEKACFKEFELDNAMRPATAMRALKKGLGYQSAYGHSQGNA